MPYHLVNYSDKINANPYLPVLSIYHKVKKEEDGRKSIFMIKYIEIPIKT